MLTIKNNARLSRKIKHANSLKIEKKPKIHLQHVIIIYIGICSLLDYYYTVDVALFFI